MNITVSTSTITIESTAGKVATFPFNSMIVRKISNTQIQIDSIYTNDLFVENLEDMNPTLIANTAAIAPTVNDDSGDGYVVGDIWYDSVADLYYQTTNTTVAAAVWTLIDIEDAIKDYTRRLVEYMNGTSGIF